MGIGVIVMIPQRMQQLQAINYSSSATIFIRFSFYLIAILLIGGGIKKFFPSSPSSKEDSSENPMESDG